MLDLIPGLTKTGIRGFNEVTRPKTFMCICIKFEPERFYFDDGVHFDLKYCSQNLLSLSTTRI